MKELEKFKKYMTTPRRVVITVHTNPDADALGSALAWASVLSQNGHFVTVISPNEYPDFLKWMKGNDDVVIYEGNEESVSELVNNAEIIFCLDFSMLNRIGDLGELVRNTFSKIV